jgi:hypothetical protein
MGLSTAAALTLEASPLVAPLPGKRSGVYGRLVGHLVDGIDARMACDGAYLDTIAPPQDLLHRVSVACGYIGLTTGFGAVTAALLLLR